MTLHTSAGLSLVARCVFMLILLLLCLPDTSLADPKCSNKCSQQDTNRVCWNETQHFYEERLIHLVNEYISVLMDIDQWAMRHQKPPAMDDLPYAVDRMVRVTLDQDHLNKTFIQKLAFLIYERMNETRSKEIDLNPPRFVCPYPKTYYYGVWRTLAICAIVFIFVLLASFATFGLFADDSPLHRLRMRRKAQPLQSADASYTSSFGMERNSQEMTQ